VYKNAVAVNEKYEVEIDAIHNLQNVAECYVNLIQVDSSINITNQIVNRSKKIDAKKEVYESYNRLAELYQKQNNVAEANEYFNLAKQAGEAYKDAEQEKNEMVAKIKFETDEKIEKIEQQNSILGVQKKQIIYLVLGLIALASIVGLVLFQNKKISAQKKQIEFQGREILHSNENNLNLLGNVFGMQGDADSQLRVQAIGLVNEILYQNKAENQPLFQLVHQLCEARNFGVTPIKFNIDVDDLNLKHRLIRDIALMLNELITNSQKHAFANTSNPQIDIAIKADQQFFNFKYADNGVGVSPQNNKNFGSQLFQTLVRQNEGIEMPRQNTNGYELNLKFPLKHV
jgi:two-component sensor histidine kinase